MKKMINTIMIAVICMLEFMISFADAIDILTMDGMTFAILTLMQLWFIIQGINIQAEEERAKARRRKIIEKSLGDRKKA